MKIEHNTIRISGLVWISLAYNIFSCSQLFEILLGECTRIWSPTFLYKSVKLYTSSLTTKFKANVQIRFVCTGQRSFTGTPLLNGELGQQSVGAFIGPTIAIL